MSADWEDHAALALRRRRIAHPLREATDRANTIPGSNGAQPLGEGQTRSGNASGAWERRTAGRFQHLADRLFRMSEAPE